jgi:dethiobiotin synthetase
MPAYFITGTGTDIGKTWLSSALLRHWRTHGEATRALKPVMSGVDPTALDLSDGGQVMLAQGQDASAANVAEISPWQFAAPLSPDMAAAAEGRVIDYQALVEYTRRLTATDFPGFTVVEGVGGVMVPLDDTHTVLDWMRDIGLPVVLVAGSYLGSMSHTLTALAALHGWGLTVEAIALNESVGSSVDLGQTAARLRLHADGVPVIAIRRAHPDDGVAALAAILQAS